MRKIICGFVFVFVSFSLLGFWYGFTSDELENNIVRLHIIANSDSPEDQALKLEIRDKITELSKKQGRTPSLCELENEANKVLLEKSVQYDARVTYNKYYVNRRNYESFVLPEGLYTAACVRLGRGAGKNWWCVLSPPLCFTKSALGYTDEMSKHISNETEGVIKGVTFKLKVFEAASKIGSFIKNNK